MKKHIKHFTPRLRSIVTPENLKSQLEYRPHGFFTRREFTLLVRREKIYWNSLETIYFKKLMMNL